MWRRRPIVRGFRITPTERSVIMSSPFPGMDPYIEASGLWGDFHDKLIGEIERTLAGLLPPQYVARISERMYIECIDPREDEASGSTFQPDVTVRTTTEVDEESGVVAVAQADPKAVLMHALMDLERRELYLEIHDLNQGRDLVTCIEILSPANKRPKHAGWDQYTRKREVFLRGFANFVEIDLLRRGQRRGMVERWPASPYYIRAMRKEKAPACKVWPAFTTHPLPEIAIPLLPHDDDVKLPIQPLVDAIYTRSRYDADIDYGRSVEPPLDEDESRLLEGIERSKP